MKNSVQFELNGKPVRLTEDGERMLLWVLRSKLDSTGTKFGCGEGHCGACTVLVNNEAVRSCQTPVKHVNGMKVVTIEGLSDNGDLHPLQKAFIKHNALQCGYCSPGMILNAYSFLQKNPSPSGEEIIAAMEGNLCRCGAYSRIIQAIQTAAAEMKGA